MSEKLSINEAIKNVMQEIKAVGKDGFNQSGKYPFRGIDGTLNACAPAFRKHGVIAVPKVLEREYGTMTTRNGAVMTTCRLVLETEWRGPAGDSFTSVTLGEAFDSGDKATSKAQSVAFRQALLQTLCLPTQEPDPDEFTYEHGNAAQLQREHDVKKWADSLLQAEQAGDMDRLQKAMQIAQQSGDGEKVTMTRATIKRMQANAKKNVAEVLDGEVVDGRE